MTSGRSIRRQSLILGGFIVIAIVILLKVLDYAGVSLAPGASYDVSAVVPNAINLIEHADVREAGIKIGQVTSIAPDGDAIKLGLSIERQYGPVYRNAQILIRSKSLAGENYVALNPGDNTAPALRNGQTLPISRAPESTQIDQILATFTPRRRADVRTILAALDGGLQGEGGTHLNELLDGTAAIVRDSLPVTEVVSSDRQVVAELINDFGQVSEGLAQRASAIQSLAADSRSFSKAIAARDADLSATITELPRFLSQSQQTLAALGSFSRLATPVVANLRVASTRLIPGMNDLAPDAVQLHAALDALGRFDTPGRRLLNTLRHFAPVAIHLLGPLETVMRQSNPMLAYFRPFAHDFGVALSLFAAISVYRDPAGHLARGNLLVGATSLSGDLPAAEKAALDALLDSGLIEKLTGKQGLNPYPSPNLTLTPWSGTYPRVREAPVYK
jgi:phospholipid/cholesterol/gamma-HCH transport system substrate-binding protein